jgi:hypothetical protein
MSRGSHCPRPPRRRIIGSGRPGTNTDGWEYDDDGHLAHPSPNGVNQVPALVDSVIRAKPHGAAPQAKSPCSLP